MNNLFSLGQRWINQARPELGLGTVIRIEGRIISLSFGVEHESHSFALETAPLERILFSRGDVIRVDSGDELAVDTVEEVDGVFIYFCNNSKGEERTIVETAISPDQTFNRPVERLIHGQIDDDRWFSLRLRTLENRHRLYHQALWGMLGGRTALLPHQLYVVHEVARRFAPRVLLADEVGLGKTIEAGLIAHYQIITERARRVLIVVPESLMHQWLVEMVRRFNLMFRVFDAERCDAMDGGLQNGNIGSDDNPFLEEQLVILTREFLLDHPLRHEQCVKAGWDLTIVDEAHHLEWSELEVSPAYRCIEQLAHVSAGLLLLTGTPAQLGVMGHFARLRLLDPARYQDPTELMHEQSTLQPVAELVESLVSSKPLTPDDLEKISHFGLSALETTAVPEESADWRRVTTDQLLDRHGVGRVMFRNTRASVKGFPGRKVHFWPLPSDQDWPPSSLIKSPEAVEYVNSVLNEDQDIIKTEGEDFWVLGDPRVTWLSEWLVGRPEEKALVICSSRLTAATLATGLKHRSGLSAAVFHEGMNLVERDRAAAWFAEQDDGCQVLVCSEIGSEGRNFQFAQHLVLFDLPANPDLLEQRIGRLDRIGREGDVLIHVPYVEDHPVSSLVQLYHQGLDAFESIGTVNQMVFDSLGNEVLHELFTNNETVGVLVEKARSTRLSLEQEMKLGRDRLLEFHSCRTELAAELVETARQEDSKAELQAWMSHAFDCYDVEMEAYRQGSVLITPGPRLSTPIPGLTDEGTVATFSRATALANEDLQFLSWEHPLVVAISDLVLNTERGNTAMTGLRGSRLKRSEIAVECIFVIEVGGVVNVEVLSRVPPIINHMVVHESGKVLNEFNDDVSSYQYINLKAKLRRQIVDIKRDALQKTIKAGIVNVEKVAKGLLTDSASIAVANLQVEVDRLIALKAVNPSVRQEEIDHLQHLVSTVSEAASQPRVRLDAVRVLVGV